eukprot:4523145-Pleurochrysis_carterae.AAC.1
MFCGIKTSRTAVSEPPRRLLRFQTRATMLTKICSAWMGPSVWQLIASLVASRPGDSSILSGHSGN